VRLPVTFLVHDSSGHGGVARTVVNLANHLTDHRDVRVVSLFRHGATPAYPLDPRVRHDVLIDVPAGIGRLDRLLDAQPTRLRPEPAEKRMTRLTDRVLRAALSRLEPGILVTTRPSLHLAATRWAADGVRVVGQDHKNFATRFGNPRQAEVLRTAVPLLDAYVVLTRADAEDYRRALPGLLTPVEVIRNALPWPPAEQPAALDSRVVVAAGRLAKEKGFGRMIEAFAPVAREHPDWRLDIYGEGSERESLTRRITRLRLDGRVRLPGYTDDFRGVLAGAAAYALTSRAEGFPMVLIEAMSAGVPLVAMDCPRGPGEIVDDGKNGLLVEDGDVAGFTEALRRLVEDDDLRRACGRRAHEDARQYGIDRVLEEWLQLFERLDG
jgi:glycosyltransferase involved in cell wall biosynthesis